MAETLRNKRSAADPDGTSGLRPSARIAAGMNGENGSMYARDAWWNALSPQLRDRIDGLLCARRLIAAVVLLRREGGLQPPPGLYQAQDLLIERRAELDRRGLVEPEPTPATTATTAQLIEKAAAITAPVVAVEALWDGDTQGWCVDLVAIVRRPGRHHDRFDEVPLTCCGKAVTSACSTAMCRPGRRRGRRPSRGRLSPSMSVCRSTSPARKRRMSIFNAGGCAAHLNW